MKICLGLHKDLHLAQSEGQFSALIFLSLSAAYSPVDHCPYQIFSSVGLQDTTSLAGPSQAQTELHHLPTPNLCWSCPGLVSWTSSIYTLSLGEFVHSHLHADSHIFISRPDSPGFQIQPLPTQHLPRCPIISNLMSETEILFSVLGSYSSQLMVTAFL